MACLGVSASCMGAGKQELRMRTTVSRISAGLAVFTARTPASCPRNLQMASELESHSQIPHSQRLLLEVRPNLDKLCWIQARGSQLTFQNLSVFGRSMRLGETIRCSLSFRDVRML